MNTTATLERPAPAPIRSKDGLGERFEIICHTKRCGWAGDWEDTSASRVEAGNVVECDPNLPDAELCCPKCLLTNLVETDGWDDDQLPRRAFRPPKNDPAAVALSGLTKS